MAIVNTVNIYSRGGHYNAEYFAFPGSNMTATQPTISGKIEVDVDESLGVTLYFYVTCTMDYSSGPLYGSSFPYYFFASREYFTMTVRSNGTVPWPSGVVDDHYDTTFYNPNNGGYSSFNIPRWGGYIYLGKLTEFSFEGEDAYVYVGGTAYGYWITNAITVSSIEVKIPGLKRHLNYFPGKIFTNSWNNANSCNRSGGYFQRLDSSNIWIDRKNTENSTENSTVFLHDGSEWNTVAPLIGVQ